MDSGLERFGSCVIGTGLELNVCSRLCTEPDLSRNFNVSGEDSREIAGETSCVRELARSAMDGDLDGARTLPFLTEKNAVDAPVVGPVAVGGVLEAAPSCSKALILSEILVEMGGFLTDS
jgi:hypothetical protein